MLKQIDKVVPLAKYYQIGESIKENIIEGKYKAGQKLPTYRELSKYFNTTMVTISNAVKLLESQGFIYKIPGSGMFVQEPRVNEQADAKCKKVGLLIPSQEEIYQTICNIVTNEIDRHDYEAIPLPGNINSFRTSVDEKNNYIQKYLKRGYDSLIINGERHFPFKCLHKFKDHFMQLNFVVHYESAIDFPEANVFTADFEKAGYLGGKYLLQNGKKKILYLCYEKLNPAMQKKLGSSEITNDFQILEGIKRAMREAGIEPDIKIIINSFSISDSKSVESEIREMLKQNYCGIMAQGDYRAIAAYRAASELGLELGRNCFIVGLFNTSWTEILRPGLTSISINEQKMGRLTAQAIIEKWIGKKILVEPELIIRET